MIETSTGTGLLLRRIALLLLAALLGWQVISLQISNHYARQAADGVSGAAESALWWDDGQPRALEIKGRQLLREAGEEPDHDTLQQVVQLMRAAIAADPARGTALSSLALLGQAVGDEQSPEFASLADRLAPVEPRVQRNLALYSLGRQELAQAVVHIARAMVGNRDLQERFFPILMQVAADPAARDVLVAIASDPRPFPWWNKFFAHVASNAQDLDALRALVQLRENASAYPLQEYERNLYINRLRQENRVAEAYLHWVNGLTPEQLQSLGYLYDGGFEHPFANDSGFGWVAKAPSRSGIRISQGATYGVTGSQALRLSFRGKRVRFSQVYQHLFLPPGMYAVSGLVRPDKLQARRGLQWRLYCSGEYRELGASELFIGTGDWRKFDFQVEVLPDCPGQVLRLYSAGNRDVDHELKGAIWFDAMQIELEQ